MQQIGQSYINFYNEWKEWFLGKEIISDKTKKWTVARFKRQVLKVICNELEQKLNIEMTLTTKKNGHNVVGMKYK